MRYTLHRLQTDVMARLGETVRPQGLLSAAGVPWPEDIIGVKVASLLGELGSRLLQEADCGLSCPRDVGIPSGVLAVLKRMPCGLYGAEVRLPEMFLRLVSVKMAGWRRSVCGLVSPGSAEWSRQWSPEPGIAGSPERPRAYLDSDGEGMLLRLLGSVDSSDTLESLGIWIVPSAGEDGGFDFPETLYAALVGAIAAKLL